MCELYPRRTFPGLLLVAGLALAGCLEANEHDTLAGIQSGLDGEALCGVDATLDVLAFFDAGVEAGTLEGLGPGRSAPNRLNAFRNKLSAALDLFAADEIEEGLAQLTSTARFADGLTRPPDFVQGPDRDELHSRIQAVIADPCPEPVDEEPVDEEPVDEEPGGPVLSCSGVYESADCADDGPCAARVEWTVVAGDEPLIRFDLDVRLPDDDVPDPYEFDQLNRTVWIGVGFTRDGELEGSDLLAATWFHMWAEGFDLHISENTPQYDEDGFDTLAAFELVSYSPERYRAALTRRCGGGVDDVDICGEPFQFVWFEGTGFPDYFIAHPPVWWPLGDPQPIDVVVNPEVNAPLADCFGGE